MLSVDSATTLYVGEHPITLGEYVAVTRGSARVALSSNALARMQNSRDSLMRQLAKGTRIYGVNTGYGADSTTSLDRETIRTVQRNTLTSHSVGTGPPVSRELTRGMLLLKANMLSIGLSGVRPLVVELLLDFLNHDITPLVPDQGSLAASGDLIPQGHLGEALIGEGEVLYCGRTVPTKHALSEAGLVALVPEEKEGLALVNGTAFTLAHALDNVARTEKLLEVADILAAATLQALKGWSTAYDERIVSVRPFPGALQTAQNVRVLCKDSPLLAEAPERVHDPYCLRCVPQVHGASRDAFAYVREATLTELNAVTDNPLIFADEDACISGGNFHAQPVGIPMDTLSVLVAELAAISQRRTQHLVAPVYDVGLPPKLSRQPKLGTGLFMLNTTASALVSENRSFSFPASVDNMAVDTTEDHVSMGSVSARKAARIVVNTAHVLALELICACQALEFHAPTRPSAPIQAVLDLVRETVPFVEEDRSLHREIGVLAARILDGDVERRAKENLDT